MTLRLTAERVLTYLNAILYVAGWLCLLRHAWNGQESMPEQLAGSEDRANQVSG
jgi:hypothetical protein